MPETEAGNEIIVSDTLLNYQNLKEAYRAAAEQHFIGTWEKDAAWRLLMRKIFAGAFSIFLLLQNIFVYWFVYYSYFYSLEGINFNDIQPVISVLVVGTIGQTVLIVKIMVSWIFSDVQYASHPLVNMGSVKK